MFPSDPSRILSQVQVLQAGTPLPWPAAPTQTSALRGRAKWKRALSTPSAPLPRSGSVSSLPQVPVPPQDLRMPCLHHLSPCRTSASAAPPVSGLNSTFVCILWLQGSWCPPGLSSSIACGLIKALTSILCTAQQAHRQIPSWLLSALSPPLLTSLSFRCSTEKSN